MEIPKALGHPGLLKCCPTDVRPCLYSWALGMGCSCCSYISLLLGKVVERVIGNSASEDPKWSGLSEPFSESGFWLGYSIEITLIVLAYDLWIAQERSSATILVLLVHLAVFNTSIRVPSKPASGNENVEYCFLHSPQPGMDRVCVVCLCSWSLGFS